MSAAACHPSAAAGSGPLGPGAFPLFWHRAGNRPAGLAAVDAAAARGPFELGGRRLVHGVELDLKWAREGAELLLYAHHGPTGLERLPAGEVRARAARGAVTLVADLLGRPGASARVYLIELKNGDGPLGPALARLVALVREAGLAERVVLASGSRQHLETARAVAPALPRLLFCSHLTARGAVLHLPLTDLALGLERRGGLLAIPPDGGATHVCRIGLVPRGPAAHRELARRASAAGLGYLPGRVTRRRTLAALAGDGLAGAFVYAAPGRW